jgi:hypothetical protein
MAEEIKSETNPAVGFLEENAGEKSAMRLISVMCVVGGIVLCIIASVASLQGNSNTGTTVQLATTLLSFGVGGKLLQKFGEGK